MTEIIVVESIKSEDHSSECQTDMVAQHQDESTKQLSTGEMKSSEEQLVEQQSNIPVLSNDRVSRQNGHINVEEFLRKQLQNTPRDRSFMLNVEEELIAFLKTPSKEHYKFDPMNPYYRMLIHRIGDYFNLGHQVDQAKLSVIVTKTDKSKIPEISFREMIKSFENLEEPEASNNNNANGSHEVDLNGACGASLLEKKASSSSLTDQPEGTKKQILKREVNSSVALHPSQQGDFSRNGFGKRAPEVKTKTYEEKSADYIRAKNRIFNTQTTTVTSNNSYDSSRMTVLNRQNENGRNVGYNQSKPMYNNNKTRQNGGSYAAQRPYNNQNNNLAQFNSPLPNGNNPSASNTASSVATSTNVSMVLNMSYLQQFPVQGGQMYQTMIHPQYTGHVLPQQTTNLTNQPSMIYNGNGMTVSNGQQPYKLMQHLNMAPIPPVSQNNGPWPQQSMVPPTLESLQYGYSPATQNILNSQFMSTNEMTNSKSSMNQPNSHLYYAMYANQLAQGQQQAAPIQQHQMFQSQMKQPVSHFPIPNGATGADQTIVDNYHCYMMPGNSFNNSMNPAVSIPPVPSTYNGAMGHQQTKFIQAGGQQHVHSSNSSNGPSATYLPPSTSHNVINSTSSYRNSNNYKNGPNMSISQKQMPRSMTHSFNNTQSSSYISYNAQRGRNMPRFGRPSRNHYNGSVYSTNNVNDPRNHTDESIKSAHTGACTVQLFDIKGDLASKSALNELLGPYALSIDVKPKDNNEKNGFVNDQTEIIDERLVDVFVSFESEEKLRQAMSNGFNMNEQLFQTMTQQTSSDIHDDHLPFRLKSLTIE